MTSTFSELFRMAQKARSAAVPNFVSVTFVPIKVLLKFFLLSLKWPFWRGFGKSQKNCLITIFFCKNKAYVPSTSPTLNGLESFVQILEHFAIFHIMGPYGRKISNAYNSRTNEDKPIVIIIY